MCHHNFCDTHRSKVKPSGLLILPLSRNYCVRRSAPDDGLRKKLHFFFLFFLHSRYYYSFVCNDRQINNTIVNNGHWFTDILDFYRFDLFGFRTARYLLLAVSYKEAFINAALLKPFSGRYWRSNPVIYWFLNKTVRTFGFAIYECIRFRNACWGLVLGRQYRHYYCYCRNTTITRFSQKSKVGSDDYERRVRGFYTPLKDVFFISISKRLLGFTELETRVELRVIN